MITAFFGLPGSGKTYALTYNGLSKMRDNKKVYSNYYLEGAYKIRRLDDVLNIEQGSIVLIDEIQAWASSRNWEKFSESAYLLFSQHRKRGLEMMITSQHPKRVDKTIRELIHRFVWCEDRYIAFLYSYYNDIFDSVSDKGRVKISVLPKDKRIYQAYDHRYIVGLDIGTINLKFEKWENMGLDNNNRTLMNSEQNGGGGVDV